jgi:hypothetical protein
MKKIVIISILFSFALISCFSPWKGEEGLFSINFSGAQNNRVMIPWLNTDIDPTYIITLDGGHSKPYTQTIPPSKKTAYFSVVPGLYNISVEAYEINEDGGEIQNWIAAGYKSVNIKPGRNGTVTITMGPPIYLIAEGVRTQYISLAAALNAWRDNDELKIFTVSINDGIHFLNSDSGMIEKIVTIENRGGGTAKIKLGNLDGYEASGPMFSVTGELTLQGNITLEGVNDNNCTLVIVNDSGKFNMGRLNMGDNVVITGNMNTNTDDLENSGGGVHVAKGAEFIMNGGTITGNEAEYGGGVCVYGGTFTMLDGIITGNTSYEDEGGGVYVHGKTVGGVAIYGTFTMGDAKNVNSKIQNNPNQEKNDVRITILGKFYKINGYVHNLVTGTPP